VVRVATLPVRKDHYPRPETAQDRGNLKAIFLGVLNVAVGKVERLAMGDSEDHGCSVSFSRSLISGATGPSFTTSQIENACTPAERFLHQKSSAAGLLDVIPVSRDGKDIEQTCMRGGQILRRGHGLDLRT